MYAGDPRWRASARPVRVEHARLLVERGHDDGHGLLSTGPDDDLGRRTRRVLLVALALALFGLGRLDLARDAGAFRAPADEWVCL